MNTLKKLVEFIRSKLGTAMAQNLSIEDQYTKAASTLIDKITELQTVRNGWRWFGRVSRNTDRVKNITNEIRVNAQVYLEFPMEGW